MKINIIKLGGSIITDKTSKANFNRKNTVKLAEELFPFYKGCIIIHGTGQVGKPPAIKHGYVETGIINASNKLLALRIKSSIRELNHLLVSTLLSVSIPAIPIDILHFYNNSDEQLDYFEIKNLLHHFLNNGIVPVFYGDLLPLANGSFKVISSDLITLMLAEKLNPYNVFFLTDVNGIYSEKQKKGNGSTIISMLTCGNIKKIQKIKNDLNDVSGGMLKKAEIAIETAAFCKRCFIGNGLSVNILSDLFNEKKVIGTFVSNK